MRHRMIQPEQHAVVGVGGVVVGVIAGVAGVAVIVVVAVGINCCDTGFIHNLVERLHVLHRLNILPVAVVVDVLFYFLAVVVFLF